MGNPWTELLRDPKLWMAAYALLHAILIYFVPGIPDTIWFAVDALVAVIVGGLTANAARQRTMLRRKQYK